ncbi:CobW family GTP-binding protein [Cytobacillus purgationiresistens]|uniref:G3E family GTPase n=1 Tax=Cytobacillus purgationiresistens TaxID=863449 RepID=A0ABU0AQN2_9BACI|nr:GTP-binding protein [Cytobacillus purgationiresistens]MDQ0273579.1 G3E family GTPase [Cytobacillus purgationiresistens]
MSKGKSIPVTILTGFLGAGKTTVLNNLLRDMSNEKVAVIINEFGDTSIDGQLVIPTREEIIEINSGCICCNVRGDLIYLLDNLMKQGEEIDRVVIETTGMANPAPVIQTFLMDEKTADFFEIDSVITLVDAKHIRQHLEEEEPKQQIAFADVLLINKMDLITKDEKINLEKQLIRMNPQAQRYFTSFGDVETKDLIGKGSFLLDNVLKIDPSLLTESHHHHHNDEVTSFVLQENRSLDMDKVNKWFAYLVRIKGESLYRYKGVLYIKHMNRKVVFQGVHMLFAGTKGDVWKKREPRKSEVVFIGKNLDHQELEEGFKNCLA